MLKEIALLRYPLAHISNIINSLHHIFIRRREKANDLYALYIGTVDTESPPRVKLFDASSDISEHRMGDAREPERGTRSEYCEIHFPVKVSLGLWYDNFL